MKTSGRIKKLTDRGFGFISYTKNGSDVDIFFHISNVAPDCKERLKEGLAVEFEPGTGRNGRSAAKRVALRSATINSENTDYSCYLPADSREIIDPFAIDNISLFLNKAAYYNGKKFEYRLNKNKNDNRINPERYNNIPFEKIIERRQQAIRALGLTSESLRLSIDWRLAVGLGNASVYETSMTLHHVYGAPYLPGSAIKGLARNWIIAREFNHIEGDKKTGALSDWGFCRIFGSPKNSVAGAYRGAVRFFDAFPISEPTISLDVINPHYGPYYSGDEPPADYHNPVPVHFLTVEEAAFDVCIGINELDNIPIENGKFAGKTPLEVAWGWVVKLLQEFGIGAKTSVGYGLFQNKTS